MAASRSAGGDGARHREQGRSEASDDTHPVVASPRERHAAEVGAHADHDEPLRVHDALRVGLLVAEIGHLHRLLLGDLRREAAADEDGLAAPLDGDGLPRLDLPEVDLEGSERKHVGGGLGAGRGGGWGEVPSARAGAEEGSRWTEGASAWEHPSLPAAAAFGSWRISSACADPEIHPSGDELVSIKVPPEEVPRASGVDTRRHPRIP